ncbi:PREDICTED: olfactory receptor 10A7-like [Corvus brachyrhynchos]|uniref:olfactory receptor 10A7-like n=1 Tax=Corvus brachyrhynchos TaxID=85066 RepID=UPI0008167B00|nr:PREDICTED: olfactory receptor 10A7-like [Corvus brachyrhynchos]
MLKLTERNPAHPKSNSAVSSKMLLSLLRMRPVEEMKLGNQTVTIHFLLLGFAFHGKMQIPPAVGQRKPFSTCAAHLLVVALFYSTAGIIHLQPKASFSSNMKKTVSLSYTVITPMLNSIIYGLRNQEFKQNLKRCTDE